ncbi:endonuclease/exonuclease/phosphatase family protein [Sphingomonas mucosissima]|uniref:endonuclease/exonuclease/phosphatase family protein n=1 Tax=Sphingomonas mucosissima TaxID=370959 RepID=UPI001FEB5CD9|nr:endonuclease/exonuclease/phosphatase family protein [Sphingomonas mucosissima]
MSYAQSAIPSASPARLAESDGEVSTTLDVLSFNIEGLGWPARRNRAASLRRIAATLADLRERGSAPDVVLLQEVFSSTAVRAVTDAGYPYRAWGPSRTQRRRLPVSDRRPEPARWLKGEAGLHVVGSGLAILSRHPIVAVESEPFGTKRCAGYDCLSNKGVQFAQVILPGVPQPIALFNTHLNSQGSSGVPAARSGAAHALQVDDVARFTRIVADAGTPAILGGDFNMRNSRPRMERFDEDITSFTMVRRFCVTNPSACDVKMSWDGDEPWMDTQDLQLFRNGALVTITPIKVEAMFDGSVASPKLSDHDGFRVTYRLTWRRGVPRPARSGAASHLSPPVSP